MEFYSAMKNETLSFTSKCMKVENIILSEISQAQTAKNKCSPAYPDFRSKTNAAILLDLGHMLRGKHIYTGGTGKGRKPKN
jgi:hypothetical protein